MLPFSSADRLLILPPFFAFGLVVSFLSLTWLLWGVALCFLLFLIIFYCFKLPQFEIILWICISIYSGLGIGLYYSHYHTENTPLKKIHHNIQISGDIIDIQDNARKARIILKTEQTNLPEYVRLNISKQAYTLLRPKDHITATAFLAPPSKPLFDGAYNFAFFAKLNGFGATGRMAQIIRHQPYEKFSIKSYIHDIRIKIAQKIQKSLPISQAAPIIAMVTGARFNIPDDIQNHWKQSGIYHLLSISGLHMTIIAGLFFMVIRHLLLLIPQLAHGGKVKKITAISVIPLAYGYVLLSGSAVPVMRAYIMVCVGLVAILCNQQVITLRSACIAFICVLMINPVDIFNVGFALSFAAVFGIIIAVNLLENFKKKSKPSKIFSFLWINFCAGYSGLPLAIYTFGSNAFYGLLANSIAVPLASLILMPLMATSIFLMLFDLHFYPLIATGYCIELLNILAENISALPYAVLYQQPPLIIWIILFYMGIYFCALNHKNTLKIGFGLCLCALIGHTITPIHDYLEIPSKQIIFYLNPKHELIKLVKKDTHYTNPFLMEQAFYYFGHNPESPYFYKKCSWNEIYITYSGDEFKCKY